MLVICQILPVSLPLKTLTMACSALRDLLLHSSHITPPPPIHCAPPTQGSLLFLIMPSVFPPQGFALISSAWNALLSARYMLGLLPYFLQILAQMSPYQTEKLYQPTEHSKP